MRRRLPNFPTLALLTVASSASLASLDAQVLFTETFDDKSNFVTSIVEFSDGSRQFFGRIPPLTTAQRAYSVTGFDGAFFAAQDINGQGASERQVVTFDAIAIDGAAGVEVRMDLAEDEAPGGDDKWDSTDFLHVDYALDGNAFQPLLWVEGAGGTGSNNEPARLDDDFDGIGEGALITSAAQTFTRVLDPGTAGSLVLRLTFDLNSEDEDIAVDNIVVSATSAPLPVTLSAFGAVARDRDVGLAWATAAERDNDYFAVEVSTDATAFAELGRVPGEGDGGHEYDFAHVPPAPGLYYYRLRQVDIDGAAAYSTTEVVEWAGGTTALSDVAVADDDLHFVTGATREVTVVDVRGVAVVTADTEVGVNRISLAGLPRGAYVLTDGDTSVSFVW